MTTADTIRHSQTHVLADPELRALRGYLRVYADTAYYRGQWIAHRPMVRMGAELAALEQLGPYGKGLRERVVKLHHPPRDLDAREVWVAQQAERLHGELDPEGWPTS